ncbi:MAG: glycosyltransferase family 39 protein, partial [Chloroflexi bacterium]|nr:glycosyltransferase family 39 protein [Chloroflexota bacterium]
MLGTKGRAICIGLGLVLLLVAILLPTGWYEELPRSRDNLVEPPIKGVTLVRVGCALEGIFLLFVALRGGIRVQLGKDERLSLAGQEAAGSGDLRHPLIWVLVATALAAVLRVYHLGADLWLDEITTVLAYRDVSAFHVLTAYTSSNNHLLNTLLIKLMVGLAGPAEWAVRLPAVVFGIACIPALYGLSRLALGRRESVLVAFLLAVSYHHVFFSQNARGYSGLLLWSMLGTTCFLRGLSGGGVRDWALYVLSMFLSVATVLYGMFIVAGHVMLIPVVCWMLRRQGRSCLPFLRTVTAVFGVLGLILFHLYASVIPQVYVYLGGVYRTEAAGYEIFSGEFFAELVRGLSAGFGGVAALGATAAMAIVGPGFVAFFRRHTVYCLTLIAPLLATFTFLAAFNLRV